MVDSTTTMVLELSSNSWSGKTRKF
jgi:hypothetical protein